MIATDALLAPIQENNPCGEDMSFSSEVFAIENARRFDDPTLEQGEWVTDLKSADWNFVVNQCAELLQTRTKDMRLAVWLSEALAKTQGFAGLTIGLNTTAGLLQDFWDTVHPQQQGDDSEQRSGHVRWLHSKIVPLLRAIPITQSARGHFTLDDITTVRMRLARNADSNDNSTTDDRERLADIDAALQETPENFFSRTLQDLSSCDDALKQFSLVAESRLGDVCPSFAAAHETVSEITALIKLRLPNSTLPNPTAISPSSTENGTTLATRDHSAGTSEIYGTGFTIRDRAQALNQLRAIADYFRRAEPHSPVAYLAETAARWGEMPLHLWLKSVVKDDAALKRVEELLGIVAKGQSE